MGTQKLISRLKASSLMEVLIGFSVLSIAFSGGWVVFRQVAGIYSPIEQFRTQMLVRQALYEVITCKNFERETTVEGRTLVRQIKHLATQPPLFEISVSCYYKNQLLETRTIITTVRQCNHENDFETHPSRIYPSGNDDSHDTDRASRPVWPSDHADL